jgi:hypothetical protein
VHAIFSQKKVAQPAHLCRAPKVPLLRRFSPYRQNWALQLAVVSVSLQDWIGSDTVSRHHAPATEQELKEVEDEIGHRLPEPLRQILQTSGGPEGFFGESYIAFFSATDLAACWRQAQQTAVGFVPFASDGGGERYGYDSRSPTRAFVLLPSIGMEWGVATLLATTWDEFLDVLRRGTLFEQKYAAH